jgi:hypothetical protein
LDRHPGGNTETITQTMDRERSSIAGKFSSSGASFASNASSDLDAATIVSAGISHRFVRESLNRESKQSRRSRNKNVVITGLDPVIHVFVARLQGRYKPALMRRVKTGSESNYHVSG